MMKSLRHTLLEESKKVYKCPRCGNDYYSKPQYCSNCGDNFPVAGLLVISYRLIIPIIVNAASPTPIPIPIAQINAKLMFIISFALLLFHDHSKYKYLCLYPTSIESVYPYSVKIETFAKGARCSVHVYGKTSDEAVNEAIDTYFNVRKRLIELCFKLAPEE
jgi:hypothetical protein